LALKFTCSNCGGVVVVRYLRPGEESECKTCGYHEAVPDHAVAAGEEEAREAGLMARVPPRVPQATCDSDVNEPATYVASRPKRLVGFLIDYLLFGIPVAIMLVPALGRVAGGPFKDYGWVEVLPFTPEYWLAILFIFGLTMVQAVLLVERGQTIGKVAVGTRIVTLDDGHPEWWRLIILRPSIIAVSTMRPDMMWPGRGWSTALRYMLTGIFIVNALSVFGPERRALHDRLAGTRVIDILRLRKSPEGERIAQGWQHKGRRGGAMQVGKEKTEEVSPWPNQEDGSGYTP
jgi:uncharacterized RDD family membrane protein YckC